MSLGTADVVRKDSDFLSTNFGHLTAIWIKPILRFKGSHEVDQHPLTLTSAKEGNRNQQLLYSYFFSQASRLTTDIFVKHRLWETPFRPPSHEQWKLAAVLCKRSSSKNLTLALSNVGLHQLAHKSLLSKK